MGFNSAFKGLNSTVGGSEWSVSLSGRLTPGEVGTGARRTEG